MLDDIDDGSLVEDSDSESDDSFRRAAKKMSLEQLTGGTVEDAAKEVEKTAKRSLGEEGETKTHILNLVKHQQ